MTETKLNKARKAWGGDAPDWVEALAEQVDAGPSQNQIAKALDLSAGIVSQVLSNTYKGRMDRIEQRVRGKFMGEKLECPVLGEIGRDQCAREQKKDLTFESPIRPRLHRACRSGCPHSRIKTKGSDNDQ
ncbi:hypothetical protein BN1012_Phect2625 [Candidatus Phaeomarinobacter ectocarpi]|uniref:Transcriptional regulator n=1 Tax=Candidatus Phaeomarinibacter ectocarpi TaxID=1458461 RepID=X5MAG7_9HYPH|nr:hypothetical protein [Candidatus Phaeomarinobacter ectocarpi]CDO60838.1 hypothetical protein BN1012_Phect2625 [Candidatus Phaeomarinobacter ectocarpi]